MFHCRDCPPGGTCDKCERRNAEQVTFAQAERVAVEIIRVALVRGGGRRDPWLIAGDGEYDELAVRIASSGARRVKLTYVERVAAASEIIRARGTVTDVCVRLSLPAVVTEVEWKQSKIAKQLPGSES